MSHNRIIGVYNLRVLGTEIPTKSRVKPIPNVDGVELHISAKREWANLIFLPLWLLGWTVGGGMAIRTLLHPGPSTPRAFFCLWLVGWLFGELWAIYSWLWSAFGKEIVKVREGTLTTKRDILGYGRIHSFPIGSVTNLRASGIFPSTSYWGNYFTQMRLSGGTVGFDSQGQIHRFGIQLTEPEAQQVVRQLNPYLS